MIDYGVPMIAVSLHGFARTKILKKRYIFWGFCQILIVYSFV